MLRCDTLEEQCVVSGAFRARTNGRAFRSNHRLWRHLEAGCPCDLAHAKLLHRRQYIRVADRPILASGLMGQVLSDWLREWTAFGTFL
jgi:hypothetical protein